MGDEDRKSLPNSHREAMAWLSDLRENHRIFGGTRHRSGGKISFTIPRTDRSPAEIRAFLDELKEGGFDYEGDTPFNTKELLLHVEWRGVERNTPNVVSKRELDAKYRKIARMSKSNYDPSVQNERRDPRSVAVNWVRGFRFNDGHDDTDAFLSAFIVAVRTKGDSRSVDALETVIADRPLDWWNGQRGREHVEEAFRDANDKAIEEWACRDDLSINEAAPETLQYELTDDSFDAQVELPGHEGVLQFNLSFNKVEIKLGSRSPRIVNECEAAYAASDYLDSASAINEISRHFPLQFGAIESEIDIPDEYVELNPTIPSFYRTRRNPPSRDTSSLGRV